MIDTMRLDAGRIFRVLEAQPKVHRILPRLEGRATQALAADPGDEVLVLGPHAWNSFFAVMPLMHGKCGLELDVDGPMDSIPTEWAAAYLLACALARDVELDIDVELSLNDDDVHEFKCDALLDMSSSSSARLSVSPFAFREMLATTPELCDPMDGRYEDIRALLDLWMKADPDTPLQVALELAARVAAMYADAHVTKSGRLVFVERKGKAPTSAL